MALIGDDVRKKIQEIFDENLVDPVKLVYFTIPASQLLVPGRETCETCNDVQQLVEEVAFHRLDQRLAALLLGKGRVLHVTHQQLADELGSVREFVSRLLKGFAAQGLVKPSREQIEILDPAGLRRLACGSRDG